MVQLLAGRLVGLIDQPHLAQRAGPRFSSKLELDIGGDISDRVSGCPTSVVLPAPPSPLKVGVNADASSGTRAVGTCPRAVLGASPVDRGCALGARASCPIVSATGLAPRSSLGEASSAAPHQSSARGAGEIATGHRGLHLLPHDAAAPTGGSQEAPRRRRSPSKVGASTGPGPSTVALACTGGAVAAAVLGSLVLAPVPVVMAEVPEVVGSDELVAPGAADGPGRDLRCPLCSQALVRCAVAPFGCGPLRHGRTPHRRRAGGCPTSAPAQRL